MRRITGYVDIEFDRVRSRWTKKERKRESWRGLQVVCSKVMNVREEERQIGGLVGGNSRRIHVLGRMIDDGVPAWRDPRCI